MDIEKITSSSLFQSGMQGVRPVIFLALLFATTMLMILWFAWTINNNYQQNKTQHEYSLTAQQLQGELLILDERLAMSALMAAKTGDSEWESRYRRYKPQLASALSQLKMLLDSPSKDQVASAINTANDKLFELEARAFKLVRDGKKQQAQQLLEGDLYTSQRQVYRQQAHNYTQPNNLYLQLERLRANIVYMDEILTMSALMAAVSGDLSWEQRYRTYEIELDYALKEAFKLSPKTHSQSAIASTTDANIQLIRMENKAFELVRKGNLAKANALLSSPQYQEQKAKYSQSIEQFSTSLGEQARQKLTQSQDDAYLQTFLVLLFTPLLFVGWLVAYYIFRNWNQVLVSKNDLQQEIAERNRVEQKLHLMAAAVENAPNVTFITDKEGNIQYVNPTFTEVTGYRSDEIIGQNPKILKSESTELEFYKVLWQNILSPKPWAGELQNRRKDGSFYWASSKITPLMDNEGNISHFLCLQEDITERKKVQDEVTFLANHDALTGLASLRLATEHLKHALSVAKRNDSIVALMFIDLDNFKRVNDNQGHDIGDHVLKETAKQLQHSVREMDTVARIGGDEFIIILNDLQDSADALIIAEKIINAVNIDIVINDNILKVGASIGIAFYPEDETDADELIKKADGLMYQAKRGGKNTFRCSVDLLKKR